MTAKIDHQYQQRQASRKRSQNRDLLKQAMEDGNAQSVIDGILDGQNEKNEYGLQDHSQ